MIPFVEALSTVLAQSQPLEAVETPPLLECLGRTLAQDVAARENIPITDNSAMDGYAVRHADLADAKRQPLRVVEVLGAEHAATREVQPGEAMKIMTGAPIPPGADAVVMVEHSRAEGDQVWLDGDVEAGQHIRPAGGDMHAGQLVLPAGTRLGAAQLGLLASLGHLRIPVVRRPRVGVLATGNELVPPDAPLLPGKVRDANSYSLCALARLAGADVEFLGIAADNIDDLRRRLDEGLAQFDVLITSGGVSMGDFDHIKHLVDEVGLNVHFRTVNVKPGKPVVFGSRAGRLFFGLPGNPVSSMVMFQQLVRPGLRQLQGLRGSGLRSLPAIMDTPYAKHDGKRHFLRGILEEQPEGLPHVRLTGKQDSNILFSMGRADCFVVLPEARTHVQPGESVTVQLFEEEPAARD